VNQGRTPHTTPDGDVPVPVGGTSPADTALATVRDLTSEIVRLVRTTATQATDGWSLATVVRSLSPELERVFAEHGALEREACELRTRAREIETQLAAREAGWNAERAALETDVAREHEHAQMLAEDGERRRTELELLTARERRLREQMETVAARANADREETLRLAREMVQSAEEARFAVVEEMETLRVALAAEQARLVEIQHERARATQGAAERDAELARARQIIEQLEASRASAAAELARARTTLVHTESELLAAQHEYQLSQVQIEKLCGAQDDMVEDRAHLVARLHDAKEREARLRLRIAGLEQRIQDVHLGAGAGPSLAPVELDADGVASALATELSRSEERTRALERELAAAKAAASAATARVGDLQAQARAAELARAAAASEAETLRTRLETVAQEPAEPAIVSVEMPAVEAPTPAIEQAAPIEVTTVVMPEAIAEPEPIDVPADVAALPELAVTDEPDESPPARALVILDEPTPWEALEAQVVPLGTDACDRVRELAPDACVVNLAAPGALATAVALRSAGVTVPFWACAIPAEGDRAWPLGRFDVVTRPVAPESVRQQLAELAPAGANVIMVGSESATQIPLRQGLLQAGMSVRTAWDRKQAGELADAVQPDVVIVDLASEAAGGVDLIVDLAGRERPPLLVVVPGTAQQIDALATALAAHAAVRGTVGRAEILRGAAAPSATR